MKRIRKKEHKEILKNPTFGQTSLDEMEAAGTITINASKKTPIKIGKSRFILDSYAPYDDVNIRV